MTQRPRVQRRHRQADRRGDRPHPPRAGGSGPRELLTKHRRGLDLVAEALLEHETIDGPEVARIVQESLGDDRRRRQRRSPSDNRSSPIDQHRRPSAAQLTSAVGRTELAARGCEPGSRASATAAHRSVADIGPTKLALTTPSRRRRRRSARRRSWYLRAASAPPSTRRRPPPTSAHAQHLGLARRRRRTSCTSPRRTRRPATAHRRRRSRRGRAASGAENAGWVGASTAAPAAQHRADGRARRRDTTAAIRLVHGVSLAGRTTRTDRAGRHRAAAIARRRSAASTRRQRLAERRRVGDADRDHAAGRQGDRLHARAPAPRRRRRAS